jgi:hypothetical protein
MHSLISISLDKREAPKEEKHPESFTILLDQYKHVRDEILLSQKNQQTALNWSSVATGAILIFALRLWDIDKALTFCFFLLVLPSAAIMFKNIWLSEIAKMMRNAKYLLKLEHLLQAHMTGDKFNLFEQWLREEKPKAIRFGYLSGIAIYHGIILFPHIGATIIYCKHDILFFPINIEWKIIFGIITILIFNCVIVCHTYFDQVKEYVLK